MNQNEILEILELALYRKFRSNFSVVIPTTTTTMTTTITTTFAKTTTTTATTKEKSTNKTIDINNNQLNKSSAANETILSINISDVSLKSIDLFKGEIINTTTSA